MVPGRTEPGLQQVASGAVGRLSQDEDGLRPGCEVRQLSLGPLLDGLFRLNVSRSNVPVCLVMSVSSSTIR